MRSTVIACLGLLLWATPASTQEPSPAVYTFKISADPAILPKLKIKQVESILADASKLLTIRNKCPVTFKLDYPNPIIPLPAGTPKDISTEEQLEAVHRVTACGSTPHCSDIKVVETISFCKKFMKNGYVGCAWRRPENGPKTMILTYTQRTLGIRHIAWAHEFGHTTGLQHRDDLPGALMTQCFMDGRTVQINRVECNCFRAGPGNTLPECQQPDRNITCASAD